MCRHIEANNVVALAILLESIGKVAIIAVEDKDTVRTVRIASIRLENCL